MTGYENRAPSGDTARMDRAVCSVATCSQCSHKGLDYEPWYREIPYSYRPFTICPKCGYREEF